MGFAGFFYAFLGFYFLYRVLIRCFSPGISFWVLLCIFLGTNLFHYTTKEMAISHSYTFCLFSLLLFHLPNYLSKPSLFHSLMLGLLLGAIALMRPTNMICILLLLGFDVYTRKQLTDRLLFFLGNFSSVICILCSAIIVFIPQLLYWKEMTGHWMYYSYEEEGFKFWKNPKILEVWFDTQNGLFLYSPMVALMIIGIFIGIRKKKYHAPVLLMLFLIATYLFASWWTWYFGGAFGHRCYVEYYAFFALPMAGLFESIYQQPKPFNIQRFSPLRLTTNSLKKILFTILLILMMAYNIRLDYLHSILPGRWDGPEWQWNWEKYAEVMKHFLKN